MSRSDKIRIREAISISQKFGDKIWEGINNIPFAIILVTDSVEFMVNHPDPPPGFILCEKDTVLRADIFYRKRQYPVNWLATFPVNGTSCIVAGTPANTGRHSTAWIMTLLHEHFHQYEYSYPGYFRDVEALGLSNGDQTGMWMLNYPFPYDSIPVSEQYKKYTLALSDLIAGLDTKTFDPLFKRYRPERKKIRQLLKPADYRYLSFQVWQEGVARYTEYKFLELMGDYDPSKEIAALPGFISFSDYKDQLYRSEMKDLAGLELSEGKRVCFYSAGFAEAILLDKLNPAWRSLFLKDKFDIGRYSKKLR
jgi:hypothetical protein